MRLYLVNYQRLKTGRNGGFRGGEHDFSYMGPSMKGFYESQIGRRRNAAAIRLINLIYNMARQEQIVQLELLPRNTA
jgi:hypothetical protein